MPSGEKTKSAAADHARASRKAVAPVRPNVGLIGRPPIKKYLSKKEVLERIGVSYPCIWSWMQQGRFPRGYMCNGVLRWDERAIIEFMNNQPRQRLKGDDEAA